MRGYISTKKSPSQTTAFMMVVCLCLAALICYGQIRSNITLLFTIMVLFLLLVVLACYYKLAFAVLLFFLPWSPLIKLRLGQISFYTVALLIVCLMCFFKQGMVLRVYQILLPAAITALTLIGKAIHRNIITNDYLCFLILLAFFPCILKEESYETDFWTLTLFFAIGIVSAAFTAQRAVAFSNISKFITVESYLSITRLSGFYGDPNFYSAHITACMAGAQLLLCHEKDKTRQIVLIVTVMLLFYCGLLSASKMFIFTTALLFLAWIPLLMERGETGSGRLRLVIGIICAIVIILSSEAFKSLFRIIDNRFVYASNMAQLTTGRTELWKMYLNELSRNPVLLMIGQGYSTVTLGNKSSHNTLIQAVFQFGLIGVFAIGSWLYVELDGVVRKWNKNRIKWRYLFLMGVGVAFPWMSLDILFFDEFFLLPVYAIIGITCASKIAENSGLPKSGW